MPSETHERDQGSARDPRGAPVEDFLNRLYKQIGPDLCPICGIDDWHVTAEPVTFSGVTQGSVEAPLQAVMLTCRRCRFLRLHVMNPILEGHQP